MARKTTIRYGKDGRRIEHVRDYREPELLGPLPTRAPVNEFLAAPTVMPDIKPFISPVGETDGRPGTPISSRSELEAHQRNFGVHQCGELTSYKDFDNSKNTSITEDLDPGAWTNV